MTEAHTAGGRRIVTCDGCGAPYTAFREEDEAPVVRSSERWPVNVELMHKLAPHARRIEEVGVDLRHALRTRESRFRPFRALKGLLRFRGAEWNLDEKAERAA